MCRDNLYQTRHAKIRGFRFDEAVSEVFSDMISRSVPGYQHITEMVGLLSTRFIQPETHVYDLGSSLGASLLSILNQAPDSTASLIGVDLSSAMIERCQHHLNSHPLGNRVTLRCEDLLTTSIQNASLVLLNYTLQFIPIDQRDALLQRIYENSVSGGALLLSEKTAHPTPSAHALIDTLHLDFKRANQYSELEISQKRTALENVLIAESIETHLDRLHRAGYATAVVCFQSLNFTTFLAVK
jgi:tRNA (cmo5U34)-methyltransferase